MGFCRTTICGPHVQRGSAPRRSDEWIDEAGQEVLANEAADETRGFGQDQPGGQRGEGSDTMQFETSFGREGDLERTERTKVV